MWRGTCVILLLTLAVLHVYADRLIQSANRRSRDRIDRGIQRLKERLRRQKGGPRTPGRLFSTLRRLPTEKARKRSELAEIIEETISELQSEGKSYFSLSSEEQQEIMVLAGCEQALANVSACEDSFHQKYRTDDGTCNNLEYPTRGAALVAFRRLAPAAYENDMNEPKGWNTGQQHRGFRLPSPREVSIKMMSSDNILTDPDHSEMLMQWGQYLDHDLSLSPHVEGEASYETGIPCEELCEKQYPCFPVPTPKDDPRIPRGHCMGMTRSAGTCSIEPGKGYQRQQLNVITAFIDASNVYGSSQEETQKLRDYNPNRGYLKVSGLSAAGKPYLPYLEDTTGCLPNPKNSSDVPCFLAGDGRVNEQLALTAMHTIWVREHNRIVTELWKLNPNADPETIYQEARKIVGAENQVITYKEWLPKILGREAMKEMGRYSGYDPSVDPTISNEFATAAMRFGHGLIRPIMFRLDEYMEPTEHGNIALHEMFFSPYKVLYEGGIDPPLRGMYGIPVKKMDPLHMVTKEITEKLFALLSTIALDLAALNVQRGRDHGLPSYNQMRRRCGLGRAGRFSQLSPEIPKESIKYLEELYKHPDNIDLWVGGMSESKQDGAKVGPTFTCILLEQYKALRDGDRFWYENPEVFSPDQVDQLHKVSLSRVLCDNADNIQYIQYDAFHSARPEDMVDCDQIDSMNLDAWVL